MRNNKYVTLAVVALVFGLIVTYWTVIGNPFKKPLGKDRDAVLIALIKTDEAVGTEDWSGALKYALQTRQRFDAIRLRLAIIADVSEFEAFERDLARLITAIELQERTDAELILSDLRWRWLKLGDPR